MFKGGIRLNESQEQRYVIAMAFIAAVFMYFKIFIYDVYILNNR